MLNRKDFGLVWNRALDNGGVLLGDDVWVSVTLQAAKPRPPAPAPSPSPAANGTSPRLPPHAERSRIMECAGALARIQGEGEVLMREKSPFRWRGVAFVALAASVTVIPSPAAAGHDRAPATGALVAVSVEVDGRPAALYPALYGPPRTYFEARSGRTYTLRLANRTGERVGVALVVDGLNAISGQREPEGARPGRMYVLGPWEDAEIRGWRTSLEEVRQFTFVDERASYAARTGNMNGRVGWVEARVFRERRRIAAVAPPPTSPRVRDGAPRAESEDRDTAAAPQAAGRAAESFPGTGWGDAAYDPTRLVEFDPRPKPSETVVLRYEYARTLRALGVMPGHDHARDRLREREAGGFAPAPRW